MVKKIFGGQYHFFDLLLHRIALSRVNFTYSNLFFGVAWWCGREVVWKLAWFEAALT
jgi:hypothetical protein